MKTPIILFAIVVILQAITNGSAKYVNPEGCFRALERMPKNKIHDMYFLRFDEAALTPPTSDMLRCYLRQSHSGDDISENEQLLEVYKKIDNYKRYNVEFGYEELEELESLGLPYSLRGSLSSKIRRGNANQELRRVQNKVATEIELSREYKDFKEYIMDEYNSKA